MNCLLFDYGGTLDTSARHWNYVLLDGYRHAAATLEPALAAVDGQPWRDAYVHGERALAKAPIITPDDDFRTLLLKKVRIELQYLLDHGTVALSAERAEECAVAIADWCDQYARCTVAESREVLEVLRQRGYHLILVTNFYGNIHAVLRAYGVADLFEAVVESAVVGVRKPDPAIWTLGLQAAEKCCAEQSLSCETSTGCNSDNAKGTLAQSTSPHDRPFAIGDSYGKDIRAAHEAGLRTIWFKGEEWEAKDYDESLPDHIISSLSQLLGIL